MADRPAPSHTLYQVSTAIALVEGVYQGAVRVETLREHGDLGLGTFENLDGEMVIVDGHVFQVRSDGAVRECADDVLTPFAVITRFTAEAEVTLDELPDLGHLTSRFDALRHSDNVFYAMRVDGHFDYVHTRAMCRTAEGVPLVQAAAVQPEFEFRDVTGTLVGFWTPEYAKTLNVPGYHLHFISSDRTRGGHLLQCRGSGLRLDPARGRLSHRAARHRGLPEGGSAPGSRRGSREGRGRERSVSSQPQTGRGRAGEESGGAGCGVRLRHSRREDRQGVRHVARLDDQDGRLPPRAECGLHRRRHRSHDGKAGVALVTSGPGCSNLVTGLATANSEGDPVVAIGGAVPMANRLKQIHQSMDTVSLFRPITKFSAEIDSPAAVSEVVANAFRAAESGRPGAAFISAPQDIMTGPADCDVLTPVATGDGSAPRTPTPSLRPRR